MTTQQEINAEKELAQLQPSQQLLDYYRDKVSKFDEDHERMLQLLQEYRSSFDSAALKKERDQLRSEVLELRSALSDINVFLHSERQQVQRLHSQNERQQLDILEANKKITILMSISGLTDGELMVFLRDPRNITILKQRLPPQLKKLNEKLKHSISDSDTPEAEIVLRQKVNSLEKQLKMAEEEWVTEKAALLQDRTLCAEETQTQQAKDAIHIKLLSARLEEIQVHLYDASQSVIKSGATHREEEKGWLAEKDKLLSILWKLKDDTSYSGRLERIQKSGSYTDLSRLTHVKPTCELKDLRRENSAIKRQLYEALELRMMYESQCLKLEQETCKLREQKEASEQLFKERKEQLRSYIKLLQGQLDKLDERRKNDVSGFYSELKLTKDHLRTIIHQLYKIINAYSGYVAVYPDLASTEDSKAVSDLSRAVQHSIADMKRRILKIEGQINQEQTGPVQWTF